MNIIKKPIVSKLLTSAGKSAASALGEKLVNRMIAPALPMVAPQPVALPPALPPALAVRAPESTQQPSSRAQELISRYSATKGTGVTMRRQAVPTGSGTSPIGRGAITIQEYIKSYKGAVIKLI